MKLVAVVLTRNESIHLARCLASVRTVTDNILVVDAFSSDDTVQIAERHCVRVVQNAWTNWASQLNWALEQLDADTDWVLRIDADEYLTPALGAELRSRLPELEPEIAGVLLRRRVIFQGRLIRWGGLANRRVMRLFRYGHGQFENLAMDEHFVGVDSQITFDGELIDANLRPLTFWIGKHNYYASLEAVEMLDLKHRFLHRDGLLTPHLWPPNTPQFRRWLKVKVYASCPRVVRALAWFLYRYVLCLGFLDGRVGAHFCVLQGFWYRYLVDAKCDEVERRMREDCVDVATAIRQILELDVGGVRRDGR